MGHKLNLTSVERSLLAQLEFNPDIGVTQVSKLLRMKPARVAYAVRSLKDRGVIKKSAAINYTQLGYTDYLVFLSLQVSSESAHKKIVTQLCNNPQVGWVGAIAGDYQYGIAFYARHVSELSSMLKSLGNNFESAFANKSITPRLAKHRFNRGYLDHTRKTRDEMCVSAVGTTREIDKIDHVLLSYMATHSFDSIREVAQKIGQPHSTVERRVNKLRSDGIITGFFYHISAEALGVNFYRLLLITKTISSELRNKLYQFAKSNPLVTMFVESIGSWDFEIEIETSDPKNVMKISQQLHALCPNDLERIQVISELEDYKFTYYPFKDAP